MKKLTESKMRYFLADERKASKEYAKYGLGKFSKDEARHARFFKMKLAKK